MSCLESKVAKAVNAFEWLDSAQDEFNETFSELSEAEIKEFEELYAEPSDCVDPMQTKETSK